MYRQAVTAFADTGGAGAGSDTGVSSDTECGNDADCGDAADCDSDDE